MAQEQTWLPTPVEVVARHVDAVTRNGAQLLVSGRVADAEAATALALYDALAGEPNLQLVKEYLAGKLDDSYPGRSGQELWLMLVQTVEKLASDISMLTGTRHLREFGIAEPGRPRPGQMIANSGPVVPVAHPVHVLGKPPIQRFDHPNAVLFVGDELTAIYRVKVVAKSLGLLVIKHAGGVTLAANRIAALSTHRIIVRLAPIKFGDALRTPGTAILLHGLDTSLLEKVRAALLS